MPTLIINGGEPVPVDSSFFKLSREEQGRRVDAYVAGNPAALQSLDPAQVPERNPPVPLGERAVGDLGEMAYGIPVAGPAVLGGAQRLAAGAQSLGGKPYSQSLEDIQTQQENWRRLHPVESESAQAAGATTAMMGPAGRALGLGAKTMLGQAAARSATGGLLGAGDAYVRGNDPKLGAVVGGIAGAASALAGLRGPVIRSVDDLRSIKDQAYDTADKLGAQYTPYAYRALVTKIMGGMKKKGLDPGLHLGAGSVMRRLPRVLPDNWAVPGAPTLTNLDHLRQIVRRDTRGSLADEEMGDHIIAQIDDFIASAGPMHMAGMSGSKGPAANAAILAAREANSRYRKAELIDTVLDRAKRAAAVSGTMESQTKRQINRILNDKDLSRGFTKAEMAQMRKIVLPETKGEAFLRTLAEFSPTGGGLKGALTLAGGAYNPALWGLSAGGFGAKAVSQNLTQGRSDALQQLISTGGNARPRVGPVRQGIQAMTLGVPLATYPEAFATRPDVFPQARKKPLLPPQ
jgi:hypothetical protein